MVKVIWAFCWRQNFVTKELSAPGLGLYTCMRILKNMYKIRLQSDFFKLATNGHNDEAFLLTPKVYPQGVVCPCPGAIYIYKIIKNVYKIRFLFLNLQWMGKVIRAFCWHQKFVPKRLYALAPGLYTCIKSLKMCIKLDFEEIILKLATYGQREKAFLLSSKFCPKYVVCPCPGLYIHVEKHAKNVYSIRLQRDCFKTCNKRAKW